MSVKIWKMQKKKKKLQNSPSFVINSKMQLLFLNYSISDGHICLFPNTSSFIPTHRFNNFTVILKPFYTCFASHLPLNLSEMLENHIPLFKKILI